MKVGAKELFYGLIFGFAGCMSCYIFYEWIQEWVDPASKFGFGFDSYTLFGVSTILFPFTITLLSAEKLKLWEYPNRGVKYSVNILIVSGALTIFLTLTHILFRNSHLGIMDILFLVLSCLFVLFGLIVKKTRTALSS